MFLAKPGGLAEAKKIVVLIDKQTASAAELLAGILRTNNDAVILGQNSYGKSAVQSQIALENGESIKLTTAVYYFSDGKTVADSGLIPDIPVSSWRLWRYPPADISQPRLPSNALFEQAADSLTRH